MKIQSPIFLFTALPCEAKPLVAHFGLKKNLAIKPYAIYSNDVVILTVTGVGKSAMAAGVAYTYALFANNKLAVMLNIGVAGNKEHGLGTVFAADKITDKDSGRNFYPPQVARPTCQTGTVCTVSSAQTEYKQGYLYDMEASAFYETATRFTTAELVQCLKVISDNEFSPTHKIKPKLVEEWISGSLITLEKLIVELTELAKEFDFSEPKLFDEIIMRWHFTSSQRLMLKTLLSRYQVLADGKSPELENKQFDSAKALLQWLKMEFVAIDISV
jgi:hypothetical protein